MSIRRVPRHPDGPAAARRAGDRDPHAQAALLTALLLPALMALCVIAWRAAVGPAPSRSPIVVTRLVFVDPPPAPVIALTPRVDVATASTPTRARPSPAAASLPIDAAVEPSSPAEAPAPIATHTSGLLDYGNLLGTDAAPITVGDTQPWARSPVRQDARPERFRMRRQVTPEDVVRGFAQLVGLWPPGYTDSPCPTLQRTIHDLAGSSALTDREHLLLQDAVAARSRYCG
ncbi:hypothetical protein CMZ82_11365 [Lysobacteraceae bacterium NML93-0792]|nr:hypothetical protein CMZ82_11365 [Xanthomonadaceae bacterium NML93-0792]PBS15805.1 hypothetical protein CMZ81_09360 [Xanthomonadaceae bacterium NML93-0793]PBS18487.1 hypothetical protein CMZ80_11185 [Xanthomonadaceae bacterium NML93-0831]